MFRLDFIPGTCERSVTDDIVFRPIRSWHSLTYAGEGLRVVNGDASGCVDERGKCRAPLSVTHRIYWNKKTGAQMSVFLSYPNGMGAWDTYFWEVYPVGDDISRFETEEEMESAVIQMLSMA